MKGVEVEKLRQRLWVYCNQGGVYVLDIASNYTLIKRILVGTSSVNYIDFWVERDVVLIPSVILKLI